MTIEFYTLKEHRYDGYQLELRIFDTDDKHILLSEIMWKKDPSVPFIVLFKEDNNDSWDSGLGHYAEWFNNNAINTDYIHIFEFKDRLQILIENKETYIAFKLAFNGNNIAWIESSKLYNY